MSFHKNFLRDLAEGPLVGVRLLFRSRQIRNFLGLTRYLTAQCGDFQALFPVGRHQVLYLAVVDLGLSVHRLVRASHFLKLFDQASV